MNIREEFEKWADEKGHALTFRNYLGEYESTSTQLIWTGWQARQPEIDALKATVAKLDSEATDLANEVVSLKAEVEWLRTKAARYDFLRTKSYEAVIPHGGTLRGKRTAWITLMHPGSSFDDAIDAAMKESK